MKILDGVTSTALFSECERFRFWLTRTWSLDLPTIAFIGLNPSRADLTRDDNTVRKCQVFARQWGYGQLLMLNLFAYRATNPRDMWKAKEDGVDIIGGTRNSLMSLRQYIELFHAQRTIAAWGRHGGDRGRDALEKIPYMYCLRFNADKSPEHPLYIPYSTILKPFNFAEAVGVSP